MALNRPFMINLYWGGNIKYENGIIKGDESTFNTSNIVRHKMSYEEFKDLVFAQVGVEKNAYKLNMSLCYEYYGRSNIAQLISDSSLDVMYFLAENDEKYWGQICIEIEKITQVSINTGFVDLLRGFGFDQPNSHNSADNSSESLSNVGDDSDDVSETVVPNFMSDIGDLEENDDIPEDTDHIDFWTESENKIRLGMQFESRLEVKKAVTLWSIAHSREFKVYESKHNKWVAKCKTVGDAGGSYGNIHYTPCEN